MAWVRWRRGPNTARWWPGVQSLRELSGAPPAGPPAVLHGVGRGSKSTATPAGAIYDPAPDLLSPRYQDRSLYRAVRDSVDPARGGIAGPAPHARPSVVAIGHRWATNGIDLRAAPVATTPRVASSVQPRWLPASLRGILVPWGDGLVGI